MNIVADLHCHTLASGHAYSTAEEMIRAAAAAGLQAVALTDHGPRLQPTPDWYFGNMRVIPPMAFGVEVFRGVEANILDDSGSLDATDEILRHVNFVVASCHTVTICGPDAEYYTAACVGAMRNPAVNVIGHPDDGRMPIDYEAIVPAAAQTHTLLEVNNHSLSAFTPRPGARENLAKMLKLCRGQGVPVVVSSDAHFSLGVGSFENSLALLREMDFPEDLVANTSMVKLKSLLRQKGWKG